MNFRFHYHEDQLLCEEVSGSNLGLRHANVQDLKIYQCSFNVLIEEFCVKSVPILNDVELAWLYSFFMVYVMFAHSHH